MNRIAAAVLAAVLVLTVSGCGGRIGQNEGEPLALEGGGETDGDVRLRVATTLFPYYDFVRQIGGDQVQLKLIIPAGMDSHSFEPTPADMIEIQKSDLFLYNGGEMEQWAEAVLESVGNKELRGVRLLDCVTVLEEEMVEGMEESRRGHRHEGHNEESVHQERHDGEDGHLEPGQIREVEYDEHIWTSPENAMKITEEICRILSEEDPDHKETYRENTERYLEKLEGLHQEFLQVSRDRKRDMIVIGDKFPFRYLAESYGLEYRAAFNGCAGDTEPSARTIAYLIGQVEEQQLPAVYYLELSSHRVAEVIGEETGAKPLLLHSCHNVTRREFEEGITYLQLMEQNVKNLRFGLLADKE